MTLQTYLDSQARQCLTDKGVPPGTYTFEAVHMETHLQCQVLIGEVGHIITVQLPAELTCTEQQFTFEVTI